MPVTVLNSTPSFLACTAALIKLLPPSFILNATASAFSANCLKTASGATPSHLIAADVVFICAKSASLLDDVTDSCIANKSANC